MRITQSDAQKHPCKVLERRPLELLPSLQAPYEGTNVPATHRLQRVVKMLVEALLGSMVHEW